MKKRFLLLLVLIIAVAGGYGAYRYHIGTGKDTEKISSSDENAVYVDQIAQITGQNTGSGIPERFGGQVEPQEIWKVKLESERKVKKCLVKDSPGFIYMPKASWPITYQYDEPENVIVKAVNTDSMEDAGRKTEEILNETISSTQTEIKYKADDVLKRAKDLQDLSAASNKQLIWIASISLLVGGIGVMNIMLVSVTERTSEIGLKKAIGAKKGSILGQFLTEAAVLTSIGGILGVISGIFMAQVINRVSGVAVSISISASVIAVLFSMAIGVIFGMLPSVKAANLNPIDALRRE